MICLKLPNQLTQSSKILHDLYFQCPDNIFHRVIFSVMKIWLYLFFYFKYAFLLLNLQDLFVSQFVFFYLKINHASFLISF